MAGRFERRKGQHFFWETVRSHDQFPGTTFLVVGALFGLGEAYKVDLRVLVRERQLGRCVRFLGCQDDMVPLYAAMDIAILQVGFGDRGGDGG